MTKSFVAISCVIIAAACVPRTGAPPGQPAPPSPAAGGSETNPPVVVATAPPEPEEKPATPVAEPEPSGPIDVASASGWSTFHGNAGRSGATNAPAIAKPKILWNAKIGVQSWLNSPLVLGKSVVLVPSSGNAHNKPDPNDGVFALDFATGKKRWHAHFDQDANGIVATDKRVFATSDDGNVYAIEIKTGKIAWKQPGKGKMYSHPLLVGERVIVGDAGGYVHAYATADGKEAWSIQLTGSIRGGASADDKRIYVASQGGEVAALDSNGKVVWKSIVKRAAWENKGPEQPIEVYSPPVVGKDAIYITFARDTYYKDQPAVYALDKTNGKIKWKAKGPGDWGNIRTTPALVANLLVYAEPYSGDVVAINTNTGRSTYRKTVGPCYFPQWSSPAAAGDLVYLPRFDGAVYAVRATSGKVEWELYLGDSQSAGKPRPAMPKSKYGCEWDVPRGFALYAPAAVAEDGKLFVGSAEGILYAIGPA